MTRPFVTAYLSIALGIAVFIGLLSGSVWINPADWFAGSMPSLIMAELRVPRVLLGIIIGAALGSSGAAMQGYLRNPLADPGLFGVSSSAALGAVVAMFFGYSLTPWLLPTFALIGAALGMALLALLAGRTASIILFTLAGVVLSSLTGSLTALLISVAPTPFATSEIVTWLMGALTDRSWQDVWIGAIPTGIGLLLLWRTRTALDALTLGPETARSLGIDLGSTQRHIILGVGLCVGGSVAVAGIIGFIGLVVPHLVRPLVGGQPSRLIVPSALAGAVLLVMADGILRVLPTASELRVGIAMSALGAPFFLWLLLRIRRSVI